MWGQVKGHVPKPHYRSGVVLHESLNHPDPFTNLFAETINLGGKVLNPTRF